MTAGCAALVAATLVACGADGGGGGDPAVGTEVPPFVSSVREAIAAVEERLGAGQEFFEVTANEQFVNVFVAVDDGAAVVPYLYVDGELQPPAPRQDGATGFTFVASDVRFDEASLLSRVAEELPETEIDAVSVYGDGVGAIYVLGGTSGVGGFLDIQVGPGGQILSVDPV